MTLKYIYFSDPISCSAVAYQLRGLDVEVPASSSEGPERNDFQAVDQNTSTFQLIVSQYVVITSFGINLPSHKCFLPYRFEYI